MLYEVITAPKRLSKRHVAPLDHDAKEKINAARLTGRDRNDTRALKRLQSRQHHLETQAQSFHKEYALGVTIEAASRRLFPLTLQPARLDMGDRVLSIPRITIQSGEKIHLEGANGTGKSTFFSYLMTQLPPEGICYIVITSYSIHYTKLYDFRITPQTRHQGKDVAFGRIVKCENCFEKR